MNRELLFYITAILLCAGILSCNKKEAIATCNYDSTSAEVDHSS